MIVLPAGVEDTLETVPTSNSYASLRKPVPLSAFRPKFVAEFVIDA